MSASESPPAPTAFDPAALAPALAALERLRQEIMAKRRRGYLAIVLAGTLAAVLGFTLASREPILGLLAGGGILGLATLIANVVWFGPGRTLYRDSYKQHVIAALTRAVAPGIEYRPHEGLPEDWFRAAGLYSGDIDRYRCEDLFVGRLGKTELWFSEVHAEDQRTRRNSEGRSQTYWVTIFKGILFVADFHKEFRGETVLTPDFAESSFGALGRWFQQLGGQLQHLPDPEFEQAFVVRASDPVEAHYILTPDMQRRILGLRQRMGGEVRLAFRGSRVFITLPTNDDLFEPRLDLDATSTAQLELFRAQMSACFAIVDELDLNTRIWTKE
jgi:hypothetical protein